MAESDSLVFEFDGLSQYEGLQFNVLAGLVSVWNDMAVLSGRMHEVLTSISDSQMAGSLFSIWQVVHKYYGKAGAIPSPNAFNEMVQGSSVLQMPEKLRLVQVYAQLESTNISVAQFRLSLVRLVERHRDTEYGNALAEAMRIHNSSVTVGDKVLQGYEDSRDYLQRRTSELDDSHDLQEGDINTEASDFLTAYKEAKDGNKIGVLTGFSVLDSVTRGVQPGELWLIAGFTSEGKSKIVQNIAYHAIYEQGKNVLFGTNEASRSQVRCNFVTRHCLHPAFDHPRGLKYSDIKFGTLEYDEEQLLTKVVRDMRSNPAYGKAYVFQIPYKAGPDLIADMVYRQRRLYPVDLVVVDYLGLMSNGRRQQRREELDDVLIQAKRIAIDAGVGFISPWQISRDAWQNAQKTKVYTKASLSDTSQSEKSTDVVLSILKMDEPDKLKAQLLKNRDGVADISFELYTNFSTSYVSSARTSFNTLLDV